MAVRETAAQKRTRIKMLLQDYANRAADLRKLQKIVDGLKEQIKEIEPGVYQDWVLSTGTAREIMDQPAARKALEAAGIAVPTKMTDPPIVVSPKVV